MQQSIGYRQMGWGIGQLYQEAKSSWIRDHGVPPTDQENAFLKQTFTQIYSSNDYLFVDPTDYAREYLGRCNMNPKEYLIRYMR